MRPAQVRSLDVEVYSVPTEKPEGDGTLHWDRTVLVLTRARSDDHEGIGYTYAHRAAGDLIRDVIAPLVVDGDALSPAAAYARAGRALRNLGRQGLGWMALSAVDAALWDLKARVLGLPLADLLGRVRETVPIYGSGGFTTYSDAELTAQLRGWADAKIPAVKMKVGSEPERDVARVAAARRAIGPDVKLFVDANGAYACKQALGLAQEFARHGVTWFEEPVSSEDLRGLEIVRQGLPPGMELAAGEYGSDLASFQSLLPVVDVLQADLTRCGGVTGLLAVAALCEAAQLPLSLHCAPALHAAVAPALRPLRHLEFFHDHVRIEEMAFTGLPELAQGALRPQLTRPGHGLTFRRDAMQKYRVSPP